MKNSWLTRLKQIVYQDMDPSYYDEIISKVSNQLTNLKLVKQNSLMSLIYHLPEQIRSTFLNELQRLNFQDTTRISRYRLFEQLYNQVPELYQGVGIYTDNILSPDVITKRTLLILSDEDIDFSNSIVNDTKSLFETIIEQTKLEEKCEEIVKTTLIDGDFYVEIVDANPLKKDWKVLQEQKDNSQITGLEISYDTSKREFVIESVFVEDHTDDASLSRITLMLHNPKHVTSFYVGNVCLGHLVIKPTYSARNQPNLFQKEVANKFVNFIMQHQSQVQKILNKYPGFKDELANVIANLNCEKATVRFVPADRMVHFKIPSSINYPYGESLFTPVKDIAKYLIAAERALLIYRLTRAPEKRVFKVNVFEEKTEIPEVLQEVIRETKQKEVAISNAGTLDALMSEITMFDDIYIPVIDGQPAFEVDTIPGGDLNAKIEDLKYYRDKLIAGLAIPPIYLRPEDQQADNKSTLAQENARFARTIIRMQKVFSEKLTELVRKIIQIVEPDKVVNAQYFYISFLPPTALMAEREQEVVNAVSNMIDTLSKYNIPPELLLKKYLPHIDWDSVKAVSTVSTKLSQLSGETQQEE